MVIIKFIVIESCILTLIFTWYTLEGLETLQCNIINNINSALQQWNSYILATLEIQGHFFKYIILFYIQVQKKPFGLLKYKCFEECFFLGTDDSYLFHKKIIIIWFSQFPKMQ